MHQNHYDLRGKWTDVFEVALMAKRNVFISELTKTSGLKNKSLMHDMDEIPATKKGYQCTAPGLGNISLTNNGR